MRSTGHGWSTSMVVQQGLAVLKSDKCESEKRTQKSKEVCLIFFNTVHFSCTAHFVCLSLSKMLLLAFLYVKATSYSVFDRKTGIYSGQKVSIPFMRKSSYRMYIWSFLKLALCSSKQYAWHASREAVTYLHTCHCSSGFAEEQRQKLRVGGRRFVALGERYKQGCKRACTADKYS